MRHPSRYLIGGLGLAVMIASLLVGLEMQLASARPGVEPSNLNGTSINRGLKGDRLPGIPGVRGENPSGAPKLPKGCEASYSSARNIYANEIAGRCVAAAPGSYAAAA
jgi:hypothetical protein